MKNLFTQQPRNIVVEDLETFQELVKLLDRSSKRGKKAWKLEYWGEEFTFVLKKVNKDENSENK